MSNVQQSGHSGTYDCPFEGLRADLSFRQMIRSMKCSGTIREEQGNQGATTASTRRNKAGGGLGMEMVASTSQEAESSLTTCWSRVGAVGFGTSTQLSGNMVSEVCIL